MPMDLRELAQLVDGTVVGDPKLTIDDAQPMYQATSCSITLVDSEKNNNEFRTCAAAAAVVSKRLDCERPQIVVGNVHESFRKIVAALRPAPRERASGVSAGAYVAEDATLGEGTYVGPTATIGRGVKVGERCTIHPGVHVMDDTVIGDDCVFFPGVVIYPESVLGDRVILHAGCIIGADGFGYHNEDGKHEKAAQLGNVVIENDVEAGANTTIDGGTYGSTRIGAGTKLDNLVQIGHNVQVGKHNLLCAQVGIAGSSSTGDYVVMGGQVGVNDHTHLADRVMIGAMSGVMSDVPEEGNVLFGVPAIPRKDKLKEVIYVGRLQDFSKDLKNLKRSVAAMQEASNEQNSSSRAA